MTDTLPEGFTVRLNNHIRICDDGKTLVGGTPTTVLHLTDTARALLEGRTIRVSNRSTRALADRLLDLGMADPVLGWLARPCRAEVTVVVAVRDRPLALNRLLTSIDGTMPIIVVDDCSTDPDRIAQVAATHRAELVALPVNEGPAGARNAGLRHVDTTFVAFVDSDVVLAADTISTLLGHFTDPRVAVAAPRILPLADTATRTWTGRYEAARSSLDMGRWPSTVRPRAPVAYVPSACMLARTNALGAGFSADMRVAEDVDLVWRLAKTGWRVRYEPAAHAWHEHRANTHEWLMRKSFYGTGAAQLARRHGRDVAPAVLAPWSAAAAAALLASRWWSLPTVAAIAAATATRVSAKLKRSAHPARTSMLLTADGLLAGLSQAMALLLRHWWPLTAAGCLTSPQIRRTMLLTSILDTLIEYRRTPAQLDPIRFGIARRLDDIAYGTGVWAGALKGRSPRALLPDVRRSGQ